MINYDSKTKFKELVSNSHYLRVDEEHPLELRIGLDNDGRKTIRFIGDFLRVNIRGTRAIEVNHYRYNEQVIISFSLLDNKYNDLFYIFCNDFIDSSRSIDQKDGYTYLVNRFDKWRGFGSSINKYLSENEIKGLIAELLFLKDSIFDKYGISNGILGWTGTESTKKDFSYKDTWYEVKATTNNTVSISSLEQLDDESTGYLIVFHLEKVSPEANGYTLNNVFDSVFKTINIDSYRTLFTMKMIESGYYTGEYYDSFVFKVKNVEHFVVTNDFPRLKKELLPSAISNVKYDIIVNMLEGFRREKL